MLFKVLERSFKALKEPILIPRQTLHFSLAMQITLMNNLMSFLRTYNQHVHQREKRTTHEIICHKFQ
jgi:hypothetical protein